jgi:hypothetical protein
VVPAIDEGSEGVGDLADGGELESTVPSLPLRRQHAIASAEAPKARARRRSRRVLERISSRRGGRVGMGQAVSDLDAQRASR